MKPTKDQLLQNAAAITAFANGLPIECRSRGNIQWVETSLPSWNCATHEYRPKPAPKTRPWNCPDDVPGPVCWLKRPTGWPCLIAEIDDDSIAIGGGSVDGCVLRWSELSRCEYSTDRKTWLPCEVTCE